MEWIISRFTVSNVPAPGPSTDHRFQSLGQNLTEFDNFSQLTPSKIPVSGVKSERALSHEATGVSIQFS
jgi:hypothetical protein